MHTYVFPVRCTQAEGWVMYDFAGGRQGDGVRVRPTHYTIRNDASNPPAMQSWYLQGSEADHNGAPTSWVTLATHNNATNWVCKYEHLVSELFTMSEVYSACVLNVGQLFAHANHSARKCEYDL